MPDPKDDPKSSEWRPYVFARDMPNGAPSFIAIA
jgi:hypothetical protein